MKKKWAAAAISAALFLCTGAGAYAGANLQEIKAYLNSGIKIKVDGKPVKLQDAQGNPVIPITYNNTTYLPVRAVSDALKIAVDWDGSTSTVLLGEKVDGVSIDTGEQLSIHTTLDPTFTTYNGKNYKAAITYQGNDSIVLYPKKKYQKLYLQIAAIDKDVDIEFKDSDTFRTLKETTTIKANSGLNTIEVDIGGIDTIWAGVTAKEGGTFFIPLTTSYYK
ncbi:stalk domain-containing protein [Cohnella faecalis]|uniref:Copper amine oxidase-like N-terminal domain-containing protein n=1 Tax=Cohnella faecalis TaxID=2315694 RepID=A0A398CBP6_9BACL|nr:stalk domain-containing protein [Cohnella faecalis]RIE00203.1 hypothetical protein D3H35_29640 [Cohnella faecalis]